MHELICPILKSTILPLSCSWLTTTGGIPCSTIMFRQMSLRAFFISLSFRKIIFPKCTGQLSDSKVLAISIQSLAYPPRELLTFEVKFCVQASNHFKLNDQAEIFVRRWSTGLWFRCRLSFSALMLKAKPSSCV